MENVSKEESAAPQLCAAGCGFFANPGCNSMCSKCARELQKSEAAAKAIASSAVSAAAPQQPDSAANSLPLPSPALAPAALVQPQPSVPPAHSPAMPANPPASPAAEQTSAAAAPPTLSPKVLEAVSAAAAAAAASDEGRQQTTAAADEADDDGPPRRVQKNTNRCFSCNKKVGLTGFKCRCGFVYCGQHRLAEAHACDFDYKSAGRESLAKANPLVQADRITRF